MLYYVLIIMIYLNLIFNFTFEITIPVYRQIINIYFLTTMVMFYTFRQYGAAHGSELSKIFLMQDIGIICKLCITYEYIQFSTSLRLYTMAPNTSIYLSTFVLSHPVLSHPILPPRSSYCHHLDIIHPKMSLWFNNCEQNIDFATFGHYFWYTLYM